VFFEVLDDDQQAARPAIMLAIPADEQALVDEATTVTLGSRARKLLEGATAVT
jgi:hypothetical protein